MNQQLVTRRILIVDDNRDAADLAAELLGIYGHVVFVAYGGRQGIQAVIEFDPDIVLLDLGMPEVDGFSVATSLRLMPSLRQPVLIAYTAWGDLETRKRSLACGFDHHLVKPAKLTVILDTIATAQRSVA